MKKCQGGVAEQEVTGKALLCDCTGHGPGTLAPSVGTPGVAQTCFRLRS